MSKQRIAVTWEMTGYIEVEAETPEEGMQKIMDNRDDYTLPSNGEYVDGSFWLATEDVEEMRIICNM